MRLCLALLALLIAVPATAQPLADIICSPTDQLRTRLTVQYGAERQAAGLREPEQVMEVWTDKNGGWTLVMRYASGTSCIVAMGEHWVDERG